MSLITKARSLKWNKIIRNRRQLSYNLQFLLNNNDYDRHFVDFLFLKKRVSAHISIEEIITIKSARRLISYTITDLHKLPLSYFKAELL